MTPLHGYRHLPRAHCRPAHQQAFPWKRYPVSAALCASGGHPESLLASRHMPNAVGRHQHVSTFPAGGDRFTSVIEDISDRKRIEDALHASEEKFATVFRFSPDAIGIARMADGVFVDVNDAFTAIMGYARSEIVGRTWRELRLVPVAPVADEGAGLQELFNANRQVSDLELDLVTGSGNVATVLLSLMFITIGEDPCVLAIAHDITKRKHAEGGITPGASGVGHGHSGTHCDSRAATPGA